MDGQSKGLRFWGLAFFAAIFAVNVQAQTRVQDRVFGEILVKVKSTSEGSLKKLLTQKLGTEALHSMHLLRNVSDVYRVNLTNNQEADEMIAALKRDPNIQYAEPNYIIHLNDTRDLDVSTLGDGPRDPQFGTLWGMENTGQTIEYVNKKTNKKTKKTGTPGADIHVMGLWKQGHTGSSDMVVAVIDTGVDYTHIDLKDQIYTNPNEIPDNGIDDDSNGFIDDVHGWNFDAGTNDPMDDNSHGTHVSGTIGAVGDNEVGVAGVNWNVKIMPLKFLNKEGSGTYEAAIEAIGYATKMGVKIMSNSWGGSSSSEAMKDVIDAAVASGALFVAAAGNNGANSDTDPGYPAAYDSEGIISVAASDCQDKLTSWSNYGPTTVDFAAPGEYVLSTIPGDKYDMYSGTSMATPHVAGGAALLWSMYPEETAMQIKARLMNSVDTIKSLQGKTVTGGRMNLERAASQ